MVKNNDNTNRNFIPKRIGESLTKINKNFAYKFGKIEYLIHSKWNQIVGSFFSNNSEPIKLNTIQIGVDDNDEKIYSNYLLVNVTPAAAIEFQHFKDKIIEKINSYFGYKAIQDLKIQQNYIPTNYDKINSRLKNISLNEDLKKETNKIKDKRLEESVVKLGLSISNEDK